VGALEDPMKSKEIKAWLCALKPRKVFAAIKK